MQSELEREFHEAMVNIYCSAKEHCRYNARIFLRMLSDRGGVQTARDLLSTDDIQYGFTELYLCDRLDLTVEVHVLKPEFRGLFTDDELRRACERLKAHGYDPCAS